MHLPLCFAARSVQLLQHVSRSHRAYLDDHLLDRRPRSGCQPRTVVVWLGLLVRLLVWLLLHVRKAGLVKHLPEGYDYD